MAGKQLIRIPKGSPWEHFLNPGIPSEVVEVICQLLSSCSDPMAQAVAKRLHRDNPFMLAVQVRGEDEGAVSIFGGLKALNLPYYHRELPNPVEYRQVPSDTMAAWFQGHRGFQGAVADFEYRPQQHQMAEAVLAAFNGQRHLVVEAGTGIGKTIAYLVPAVLWATTNKVPVVVSTNTKNLQEQIFSKDLPAIARMMSTPFSMALIKGRSNYLCLNRLEQILSQREVELQEEHLVALAHVCAWVYRTQTGDLSELEHVVSFTDRLSSTSEECAGRKCRNYGRCFLQRARALSLRADIVITNHSVFFSEPEKPLALPKTAQVIFDEAHNLEEAATRKFERDVTNFGITGILRKLYIQVRRRDIGVLSRFRTLLLQNNFLGNDEARTELFQHLDSAIDLTAKVRQSARKFLFSLANLPQRQETEMRLKPAVLTSFGWQEIVPHLEKFQDALFELTSELEKIQTQCDPDDEGTNQTKPELPDPVAEVVREVGVHLCSLHDLADTLEFTTSFKDKDWVYWVSISKDRREQKPIGSLHAAPIEIAQFMADTVYAKKESVILCSATLNVSHSPDFIAHRIGLDRIEPERVMSLSVGSPFRYQEQCLAMVPLFLPDVGGYQASAEQAYIEAFSALVSRVAVITHGRMLILFTSYRMMVNCAELIRASVTDYGIRILVQGAGQSREVITALFREDCASILMGTDSFWEGVDLIGDTLQCVVIARLPFDAVNDPVVGARSERVAEKGGDSFREFSLPNAIIKFRQGFGRLIRHKEDRGVVIVADQRVMRKNYGASFRKNLPAELVQYADEATLLRAIEHFFNRNELESTK